MSILRYDDNFTHNVSNTGINGFLFSRRYDEPTYITIRVNFFPDYSAIKSDPDLSDFNSLKENSISFFNYNEMPEPLLDPTGEYSTYKYLKDNIGDEYRAELLKNLIKGLADLSWECPYYISSVSGINDLLSIDPKRGTRIKKDAIITLKCIEGLDQRISAIKNLYKKIAWDDVYQRWILPDIMRYFKMQIQISEFRIFHRSPKVEEYKNSNNTRIDTTEEIKNAINKYSLSALQYFDILNNVDLNKNIPTMCLNCYMCEFDITDSFSHISEISTSNKNNPLSNLEIKIKVGNIVEDTDYNLFGFGDIANGDAVYTKIKLNDKDLSDLILYKKTNKNNITGKAININDYTNIDKLGGKNKKESYLDKLIKNTVNTALSYAKNYVDDAITDAMNMNLTGTLSVNDILNAVGSANIFSMYNILKTNLISKSELYPEVSKATKQKLSLTLFEDALKDLSESTATDETTVLYKNISKQLLDYGNKSEVKDIDDYMNILKDIMIKSSQSLATNHNQKLEKLDFNNKNIAL